VEPSFDISTVKSHGLCAPTPDPQLLFPTVPTTLKLPSDVPGNEDELVQASAKTKEANLHANASRARDGRRQDV
jgi:hypothetical protein